MNKIDKDEITNNELIEGINQDIKILKDYHAILNKLMKENEYMIDNPSSEIFNEKILLNKNQSNNQENILILQNEKSSKKEKECDEFQAKISDFKKNKNNQKDKKEKNENTNNTNDNKKEEKKIEEKKDENKEKKEEKKDIEVDPKSLAKEKINQLANKGDGMKKLNFAELLKKNQEKKGKKRKR